MKKIVYLCGLMLLSMNMMAQIDLNDRNWDTVFFDDFTEMDRHWDESWLSNPVNTWMAFPGFDVIDGWGWYQVYQYANNLFCPAEGEMKLVGEYCDTLWKNNYPLPGFMGGVYPSPDSLFYFSGYIESYKDSIDNDLKFQYGYFEIRCKLPKHEGAHSGFWLQNANPNPPDTFYEEIDIVEYSWSAGDSEADWLVVTNPNATEAGDPRFYSTAISQNLHGQYVNPYTDVYSMVYPHIPNNHEDVSGWHTYSCEWMPDHVYLYLDGELVSSFYDKTHIPRHPLTLKTNYGIDGYGVIPITDGNNNVIGYDPGWMGTDTLTIDFIRVYQLDWDCGNDEVITCQNDLNSFIVHPSVKNSISLAPINGTITIGNMDKVTFRVANTFEITSPFQANSGCEFTVIRQDCPE
jgi:hypothetical protein